MIEDQIEISNQVSKIFEDLAKAGYKLVKKRLLLVDKNYSLEGMDVEEYLTRKGVFDNSRERAAWLEQFKD